MYQTFRTFGDMGTFRDKTGDMTPGQGSRGHGDTPLYIRGVPVSLLTPHHVTSNCHA
jgi:hypothetical protein